MEIPLLEMEGTGAEVAERLSGYADQRVHVIVLPARSDTDTLKDLRPITEALAEIAAGIPEVEAAKFPPISPINSTTIFMERRSDEAGLRRYTLLGRQYSARRPLA